MWMESYPPASLQHVTDEQVVFRALTNLVTYLIDEDQARRGSCTIKANGGFAMLGRGGSKHHQRQFKNEEI